LEDFGVIKVAIRTGESSEKFLQRFKRICSKEGVLKEIKKRVYYEKPSERKRRREKELKKSVKKKSRAPSA
jgi:small subunit ribosomal protein S21